MPATDISTSLPIIWKDSADEHAYDDARVGRVFNARRPKRYPIAVVQAENEDHIVGAVKLANTLDCRVSVRSGGHSWAAWSVRDNAVLIDLGKWNLLSLDEAQEIAVVSPSTTGRMLNTYLSKRGFLFPGGHCPDVGLGGFLLQGGMGWNCKNWGWACENIVALDVVTPGGDLIRVDEKQNSDLLFAARGAGPGFPGIVTRFHLKVRKIYRGMLASTFIYPVTKYEEVMDWAVKISPDFDDGTEIVVIAATPEGSIDSVIIAHFVVFKNSEELSALALAPANHSRPEGFLEETVNQPTSLAKEYADQANANPTGHRYCAENGYVKNNSDVTALLKPAFTTLPHPKAFAIWFSMAPCSRRNMPDMALSMQTDHYFAVYTVWEHEDDDNRCQSWTSSIMKDLAPHCEGAYLGDSDFQVRQTKFWTDEKARKLMKIRRERDPNGRICGYLDAGDMSGVDGLENIDKWCDGQ